jgi:alpha-glucuronidase
MKKRIFSFVYVFLVLIPTIYNSADDGYRLWLKYDLISDVNLLQEYRDEIQTIILRGESATIQIACKELLIGSKGLLGKSIPQIKTINKDGTLVVCVYENLSLFDNSNLRNRIAKIGNEGFLISK